MADAVGKTITWQAFSSSSRNQMAARTFVQTFPGKRLSGSLFVIETTTAKKIEMFSSIPSEQEVLLLPNSQFSVKKKLETQEEKEAELDDLDAYNMEVYHACHLTVHSADSSAHWIPYVAHAWQDLDVYLLEQLD